MHHLPRQCSCVRRRAGEDESQRTFILSAPAALPLNRRRRGRRRRIERLCSVTVIAACVRIGLLLGIGGAFALGVQHHVGVLGVTTPLPDARVPVTTTDGTGTAWTRGRKRSRATTAPDRPECSVSLNEEQRRPERPEETNRSLGGLRHGIVRVAASAAVAAVFAAGWLGGGGVASTMAAFEELREDGVVVERKIDYACIASKCGGAVVAAARDQRALHELTCLSSCGIDDIACQMRCGDMYEQDVLRNFHVCAIAEHHCVPQRRDIGRHMLPDPAALPATFEPERFSGEWFITHGLNGVFDCFDCQRHIVRGEPGKMVVDVEYRVARTAGGSSSLADAVFGAGGGGGTGAGEGAEDAEGTFTRSLRQTFLQDPEHPGVLQAADNGYLHQRDDWFILDADPDSHMLVYYTGCNDAWCGYVGGVVYSRTPQLAAETRSRLVATAAAFGIRFQDMCSTDNSCALHSRGVGDGAAAAGTDTTSTAAVVVSNAGTCGAAADGEVLATPALSALADSFALADSLALVAARTNELGGCAAEVEVAMDGADAALAAEGTAAEAAGLGAMVIASAPVRSTPI
ncbi:unnamed protein product [Phaeothamnion confervicola]